jgi:hypothetical protein
VVEEGSEDAGLLGELINSGGGTSSVSVHEDDMAALQDAGKPAQVRPSFNININIITVVPALD